MSEDTEKNEKQTWWQIVATILFLSPFVCLIGVMVWSVTAQEIQRHQYVLRTDAMEAQLNSMKEGQFITHSYYHANNFCLRYVRYVRIDPVMLVIVGRDADGSLDTSMVNGDNPGETISRSCSPSDIAGYRHDVDVNQQLLEDARQEAAAERRESAFLSFFQRLKKGDTFTEVSDKFGPAFCRRFVAISSSGSSIIAVATRDWNGPSTTLILNTDYSIVRGCTPGSTKLF